MRDLAEVGNLDAHSALRNIIYGASGPMALECAEGVGLSSADLDAALLLWTGLSPFCETVSRLNMPPDATSF